MVKLRESAECILPNAEKKILKLFSEYYCKICGTLKLQEILVQLIYTGGINIAKIQECQHDKLPINLYELIGIILGDGSIGNYPRFGIYVLEITGNATEEGDYFKQIAKCIETIGGSKPRIFTRKERLGRSLRLVIYSKLLI